MPAAVSTVLANRRLFFWLCCTLQALAHEYLLQSNLAALRVPQTCRRDCNASAAATSGVGYPNNRAFTARFRRAQTAASGRARYSRRNRQELASRNLSSGRRVLFP